MATNLRIKSLTVATSTAAHTFDFAAPITFVTGSVGMAKSTLVMLIKHAFGGNAALTPAVVQHATRVELGIEAGQSSMILRRRIGEQAGVVEVIEPGSGIVEQTWPVSPTPADAPSISRFLLESLGIPVERVPSSQAGLNSRTVALTFNDIFRYCYMQAKEIDRSVVAHLDQNLNPKRVAAFELLFGLTDPELIAWRRQRGIERDRAAQLAKDSEAIERFIVEEGAETPDTLRAQRLARLEQLHAVEDRLSATRQEVDTLTAAEQERRAALSAAVVEATKLRDEAELMNLSVQGRQAALAQLRLDLAKSEGLSTAIGLLAPFEFTTCPRCAQPLDLQLADATDCLLCHQPIAPVALDDSRPTDQSTARLRDQITETEQLLAVDLTHMDQAHAAVRHAEARLEALHRAYDEATGQGVSPRIDAVARLSTQAEALRQQIHETDRLNAMWRRLDGLRAQIAGHRKVERQLDIDIRERRTLLRSRGAQLDDLSDAFKGEVERLGIPIDGVPRIDHRSFLPFVGDTPFEALQASGGGASTAINIAYHLTLLTHALDHPAALLPNLLIIDSPRKAIGNTEADRALGRRIYSRIMTLAETYRDKIELIVADNDLPTDIIRTSPTLELTSQRSTVPGVVNTGVGLGRVEDL